MWSTATTEEFDAWFTGLNEDGRVEVMAKVQLLRLLGPRLGRPHADTLNGSRHANMKELRADTKDQVLRIAFALGAVAPVPRFFEDLKRFLPWSGLEFLLPVTGTL